MREIKFRQPILIRDKFSYWHYWGFIKKLGFVAPVTGIKPMNEVERESGQYTGLKDNTKWEQLTKEEQTKWIENNETNWNGKEIYEGDIVKSKDPFGANVATIEIIKFDFIDVDDSTIQAYGWECAENCEVIGNIFENKELLNGKH